MAINDINQLRLLELFGGNKVGENRVQPPVFGAPTPPDSINAAQSYEDLFEPRPVAASAQPIPEDTLQYTPETASSEAYQKHLGQTPEYQDPGIWDRLIAGGLTLGNKTRGIPGGYEQGKKYLEAPYDREMEAWKTKAVPLGNAATLENQRNVNSRNLAALELKERMDTRKQDETERKNKALEESRRIRDTAYAAKANGYDIKIEGDRVMATHPSTLQRVDLGPSGGMDKMDQIILEGKQAQQRAETMAEGAEARAKIAAETSRQNTITAGAQTQVDADTQKPVVINPREATPTQRPVIGGTAIKKIPTGNRQPGEVAPARGDDLARVRVMTAESLRRIKNDFLVMPDPKNKDAKPTLNPGILVATGWKNWDPNQYKPESPQRRAVRAQENLKDLLTLSLIGDMKEQSKTGATGFGQLTGRELDVLERAASRLDWAQDEATLTQELIEILEKLERIMQPSPDEQGVATTPKRKETPAETIKRLGGG
jgi:hypothetical protein